MMWQILSGDHTAIHEGESLPGYTLQPRRRHHKKVPVLRPLQDRPSTEPSRTYMNNLHRRWNTFLLKTTSFLVSHNAQHKAAAPTRICAENYLSIPLNQLPNMLRALRGGINLKLLELWPKPPERTYTQKISA